MNKSLPLLLVFSLLLVACGPTKKEALRYDDMINGEFERFSHVYTEYMMSRNKKLTETEDYRVYACNQAVFSLDTISRMKDFYGDSRYLDALKNYVVSVQKSMQDFDGPKIRLLMRDSLMTGKDSAEVERLTKETLYLTDKAFIEYQEAQKIFRKEYEIEAETKN